MTAPGLLDQAIAAFALHAVWQVPLLACAAWMAVRVGRPTVRVAHPVWVATLVLCVAAPLLSTWQGYRSARARADVGAASISYSAEDVAQNLPAMQRESAWLRLVHKHVNSVDGVRPFTFALPPRVARGITVVYLLLLAVGCMRFGIAWRRAKSLVQAASSDVPQEFVEAMRARCDVMECAVPHVAISDEVGGPLLAGVMKPTLLLPVDSINELSREEVEAVLAHELSHLRRYDHVWHAACSVLLLPVQFHPVATWVAGRIRQTREMACDADAAAWMGSSSRYADALLCVAERMAFSSVFSAGVGLGLFDVELVNAAAVRDGWPWSKSRPATAGLELFGATGAMEERMQSMMKHNETRSLRSRWTRGVMATIIAASGLAVACMIQVQPTFAAQQAVAQPQVDQQILQVVTEDHAPVLVSGHSAQRQLRDASRKLNEAQENATSDDDRNKIATAQQVLRMAQSELAEQSEPETLTIRVSPRMKLQQDAIKLEMKPLAVQKFSAQQEQPASRIAATQLQQQKQMMVLQLNRADVQQRVKVQVLAADKLRLKLDAPALQDRVQKQMADVKISIARIQKDPVMIAKLEPPVVFIEQQDAPKIAKISSGVMAGQIVNKTQPVYPQSAKDAKITGSVVLHAIVDETGKVESLSIISSPDKDLSRSAIDAVQHWTYKPYLLNGNPTAVDTTVTVNYTFGG